MNAQQRYRKKHRDKFNADARAYERKLRYDFYSKIIPQLKENGCSICGYNICDDALEFHHVNNEDKSFSISRGYNYSPEKLALELNKCMLLCSNCHRELRMMEK
ncbi:hypothetical protein KAX02_01550 [candidate division WOR-3 bacterium]|nr:hypothetical protein [candidate division WOR-3 bacterium]